MINKFKGFYIDRSAKTYSLKVRETYVLNMCKYYKILTIATLASRNVTRESPIDRHVLQQYPKNKGKPPGRTLTLQVIITDKLPELSIKITKLRL